MKRKLSPWCKEVKKTLIDRDMSVTELCGEVIFLNAVDSRTAVKKEAETKAKNLGELEESAGDA